jgi:PAS domain S-box-containing protein
MQSDGKINSINRKGSEIFGFENNQIYDINWFDLIVENDTRESMVQVLSAMESGILDVIDYYALSIYDDESEERILSWRCESLKNEKGQFLGIMGSGFDITSHIRAETQLKSAAKTAMLYLDIMGHDILNKLQVIQVSSEIIKLESSSPKLLDQIDMIESSVSYCINLISQVRECSQLFDVPLEERSLTDALRTVIGVIREKYPAISLSYGQLPSSLIILADMHLEILLFNILENAIIHNENENPQVWIKMREADEGYEVLISDNGKGIPEKKKKMLLNPQRRTLGIGLQQATQIAEKYKGHISINDRIEGKPDKGAEIIIWLPN